MSGGRARGKAPGSIFGDGKDVKKDCTQGSVPAGQSPEARFTGKKSGKDSQPAGIPEREAGRLDRLLAREGFGTRSLLKKAIRAGRALVNGSPETDPGRHILPDDEVLFDGKMVGGTEYEYYMLHKPAGVITATEDPRERTVLDLLREKGVLRRGLFPVGRLDKDTEGLLLLTDDGALAHALLSPARHVDKTYFAVVSGHVGRSDILSFAEGMKVDSSFTALPARLELAGEEPGIGQNGEEMQALQGLPAGRTAMPGSENTSEETQTVREISAVRTAVPGSENTSEETQTVREISSVRTAVPGKGESTRVFVTIREGKYHQIRRMFEALGKKVLYLKRLSMGSLRLDPALAPGEFRRLTEEEILLLREKMQ